MLINPTNAKRLLKTFDFRALFIEELGWDHYASTLRVTVDDQLYTLNAIANKRGMVAYLCTPASDGRLPDYPTRRKIEMQTARMVHEHLIIYTDAEKTTQVWQWVKRELGKPLASREHTFHRNQSGDALIQKLQAIAFSLAEEENLTLIDVTSRVRVGFDIERVTRRFYDRFKTEHDAFQKFVTGIPDAAMERWYVSVMLNRLMFIYFIQKKSFLDGDMNYLRNRLAASQRRGKDRFYRDFLCPLFFEGFAKREQERSAAMNELLGKVPYLNGGIFQRHQIEELHGKTIQIPDAAFARLFDFFEQYQWHLDERPLRNDNEINPDVLGYIFEKYINQKQMGAYYTKEDITGYISQNTIIPFLFDAAKVNLSDFQDVLASDADRYIYDAVKHGATLPLPPEIAAGLNDVTKRTEWNKPAPAEYALPTEIWREVVARRQRYVEVQSKIVNREIANINDFITYNLNIRQFAQDVIQNIDDPAHLRAFWHALENVSVLDPTVGSGAFLFAALNILESLYEACLDRMQAFVDELERSGEKHRPEKFSDFRAVLERVAQHPNRKYFVFKSIVVNNLYGVDIMEEAVEICKLRLFLKLVAQVERVEDIEPLPDIDFNIRAGNSLVGFATYDEVRKAVLGDAQAKMDLDNDMVRIDERAEIADRAFKMFREMQTKREMDAKDFAQAKQNLRARLKELEDELNRYLAREYGIPVGAGSSRPYEKWLASHKPFHWFIEFYGIIKRGGFDVIIGNPPYVEYSKVKDDYTVRGYTTESCGNLFPMVVERSYKILLEEGRFGMILQHSGFCTPRMKDLIDFTKKNNVFACVSFYECRPGKLFDIDVRLAIPILKKGRQIFQYYAGRYFRFLSEERPVLFQRVKYVDATKVVQPYSLLKIETDLEASIAEKMFLHSKRRMADWTLPEGKPVVFYSYGFRYWAKVLNFRPYFEGENARFSTGDKTLSLQKGINPDVIVCVMNSSLFYWYYSIYSDGHNFTKTVINDFPFDYPSPPIEEKLKQLCKELMADLKRNAKLKTAVYQSTGEIKYEEYYASKSKPIIDEIDRVLAQHYGFTDEELDFIINYDIKYRMGREAEEAE
jgi:hypothetical protein